MKKSLELKETRSSLVETLEGIKNTAEGETRNLNEAEATEVDNTLDKIDALDLEIKRAERMENEMRVLFFLGLLLIVVNAQNEFLSFRIN